MGLSESTGTVHIIGAGLAGLSAAVHLARQGRRTIALYEGAPQAGGRCRSYYDEVLERRIDNGNHLMLSGNRALMGYLETIGSRQQLVGPDTSRFDFYDYKSAERWCLDFGNGFLPWALLKGSNRIPGSHLRDYLDALKLRNAHSEETVEAVLGSSGERELYERLWHPLAMAVLNTDPSEAGANLLWAVFKQAFSRGGRSCRPVIAAQGLSKALVTPALDFLTRSGVEILMNTRLKSIGQGAAGVDKLTFNSHSVPVMPADMVILALPPHGVTGLIKGISTPTEYRSIINGHFILPKDFNKLTIIGLTNALSQWIFVNGDTASVTISAADSLMELSADTLAERLWPEILATLGMADLPLGKHRIIREKRATIAQTPRQNSLRPSHAETSLKNLILAGDWTATGLPATIEGAIQSGVTTANRATQVTDH